LWVLVVRAEEDDGPWAPIKQDKVVTDAEKGVLTEEQKKFRYATGGFMVGGIKGAAAAAAVEVEQRCLYRKC
jgi:hypothetical protein